MTNLSGKVGLVKDLSEEILDLKRGIRDIAQDHFKLGDDSRPGIEPVLLVDQGMPWLGKVFEQEGLVPILPLLRAGLWRSEWDDGGFGGNSLARLAGRQSFSRDQKLTTSNVIMAYLQVATVYKYRNGNLTSGGANC